MEIAAGEVGLAEAAIGKPYLASTGASRVAYVNGSSAGHVYMVGCNGGVTVAPGTGCTWEAKNCQGPSPAGNLNIRGVVT